jgi:multimeric flavodoxin WrbA
MERSDLLVFTSPVYVLHSTGQMKTFLDHFGYRFMIHRPSPSMFKKEAVVIATAAGGGMKSTLKDMKDSLSFWGVPKIYSYGKAVASTKWSGVSPSKKHLIEKQVKVLAVRVQRSVPKRKACLKMPGLKVFFLFHVMRLMHKYLRISEIDSGYWKAQGWLSKTRPWKSFRNTAAGTHTS